MTRGEIWKDFFKKVIVPVLLTAFLFYWGLGCLYALMSFVGGVFVCYLWSLYMASSFFVLLRGV